MSLEQTATAISEEKKPQVTKGSIWVDESYDSNLYIHFADENGGHGYVSGPCLAISRQDFTPCNFSLSSTARVGEKTRQIYPALQDVNAELLMALESIICPECEHTLGQHADEYGCEVERGDKWAEGNNCGGMVAQGPCHCKCEDRPDLQVAVNLLRKLNAEAARG